jgi:hypothetical protein
MTLAMRVTERVWLPSLMVHGASPSLVRSGMFSTTSGALHGGGVVCSVAQTLNQTVQRPPPPAGNASASFQQHVPVSRLGWDKCSVDWHRTTINARAAIAATKYPRETLNYHAAGPGIIAYPDLDPSCL